MLETMNPQFMYYMLLFLLAFTLRFIRTFKLKEKTFHNYLFFSFEFVNVSAGVFIILSEQITKFVAPIMMTYVILVVISFFLDSDEKLSLTAKAFSHFFVSMIVLSITMISFLYIIKPAAKMADENKKDIGSFDTYRALVKYLDIKYDASVPLCVLYVDINATSADEAKQKAIRMCQDPTQQPMPRRRSIEKTNNNIQCVDAVVEQIKPNKLK